MSRIALRLADGATVDWDRELRRCPDRACRRQILALRSLATHRPPFATRPARRWRRVWIVVMVVSVLLLAL